MRRDRRPLSTLKLPLSARGVLGGSSPRRQGSLLPAHVFGYPADTPRTPIQETNRHA